MRSAIGVPAPGEMASSDYSAIRAHVTEARVKEDAVSVNQRALIDKILARYASENTILRELLQNADDARATEVEIHYQTLESAFPRHRLEELPKTKCKRLVVKNDGDIFTNDDWNRLKRIAEGNPDESKIGAFGVGYYSVFSVTESPMVISGSQAMVFNWHGNQLFAKRAELQKPEKATSVILDFRDPAEIPELVNLTSFILNSLIFVQLSSVKLYFDDIELLHVHKKSSPLADIRLPSTLNLQSSKKMMRFERVSTEAVTVGCSYLAITQKPAASSALQKFKTFAKSFQALATTDLGEQLKANAFLRIGTAHLSCNISSSFGKELERSTKKKPPKTARLSMNMTSKEEMDASTNSNSIMAGILPNGANGRVYIGFATHQTTGIGSHLAAPSLIPTVERESIDLVDRFVKVWNFELLQCAGILCRVLYDHEISQTSYSSSKTSEISANASESVVHILNHFSFAPSTPNSAISDTLSEAFLTCSKAKDILIPTSNGIVSSSKTRLIKDENFLETVAVIDTNISNRAPKFIDSLQRLGLLVNVTMKDIEKDLSSHTLDKVQGNYFIEWIAKKRKSGQLDSRVIGSLISNAIVSCEDDTVINLDDIDMYVNPQKIPASVPFPDRCLPFEMGRSVARKDLEIFGWTEIDIVTWAGFMCSQPPSSEKDPKRNLEFAKLFLNIVCKQWEASNQVIKAEIIALLCSEPIVPTKKGLLIASQTYFHNIKLFSDLPIIESIRGVRETFLLALGVRRTIEMPLILDKLGSKDATVQWSSKELIRYLTTNRGELPKEDLALLAATPFCEAANEADKARKLSDLFFPSEENRALALPILSWSDLKIDSEECIFMQSLGLRLFPDPNRLIELIAKDISRRDYALSYFIRNFFQNGYNRTYNSASVSTPFLPIRGKSSLSIPRKCYSNPDCAVFGCLTLETKYIKEAEKFGVKKDPPIGIVVNQLLNAKRVSKAKHIECFEYLAGRTFQLEQEHRVALMKADMIPINDNSSHLKFVAPETCYLATGQISEPFYAEIFDFVDFGPRANHFLVNIGCRPEPTTIDVSRRTIAHPTAVYAAAGSDEVYLRLLRKIADQLPNLKKDANFWREMCLSPFLLAEKYIPMTISSKMSDDELLGVKQSTLSLANGIVVIDDVVSYNVFRQNLLTSPQIDALESFYENLGSKRISQSVQETCRLGVILTDQSEAVKLKGVIVERSKLFLHEITEELSPGAKNIESVDVSVVDSIALERKLLQTEIKHFQNITAHGVTRSQKLRLYVTPNPDNFDIGNALSRILLRRHKPASALLLASLVSTKLSTLRDRGYNVDRILQAKAAQKYVEEEERKNRLLREQEALDVKLAEEKNRLGTPGVKESTLQNTPTLNSQGVQLPVPLEQHNFFSRLRRNLGIQQSVQDSPPPYENGGKDSSQSLTSSPNYQMPSTQIGDMQVTSMATVQNALTRAIQSARKNDSSSLFHQPQVSQIKEAEQTYCDTSAATNLTFATEIAGSKIYIDSSVPADRRDQFFQTHAVDLMKFVQVLTEATHVFDCNPDAVSVFYDTQGPLIGFNRKGSIFCNVRYYLQLHIGKDREALCYWWVVLCHELAHNLVSDHSSAHSFYTESFVMHFMEKLIEVMNREAHA